MSTGFRGGKRPPMGGVLPIPLPTFGHTLAPTSTVRGPVCVACGMHAERSLESSSGAFEEVLTVRFGWREVDVYSRYALDPLLRFTDDGAGRDRQVLEALRYLTPECPGVRLDLDDPLGETFRTLLSEEVGRLRGSVPGAVARLVRLAENVLEA